MTTARSRCAASPVCPAPRTWIRRGRPWSCSIAGSSGAATTTVAAWRNWPELPRSLDSAIPAKWNRRLNFPEICCPATSAPTTLRFRLSQNYSLEELPFPEFTVPIDHTSLAGYTAATGEPLVIEDVYLLPNDVSYRQNRTFDEKFGYRTKSMLVIPMRTHRDEIIGVLQLINRKRDHGAVL